MSPDPARTTPARRALLVCAALTGALVVTVPLGAPAQAAAAPVTDAFSRTVNAGWGVTETGQAWSPSSAAAFSVDGASGVVTQALAGKRLHAALPGTDVRDATVSAVFRADKPAVGWGQVFSLVQRRQLDGSSYEGRLRVAVGGAAFVGLVRRDPAGQEVAVGAEAAVALTAAQRTALASAALGMRVTFQVSGAAPATLRLRAWPDGTAQPTTWQVQATEATRQLGGFGAVGVSTLTSSSTSNLPVAMRVDDLAVTDETASPADVPGQAFAVPRYGSAPLGTTRYPLPATTRYVSPSGSDLAAGTLTDPWRTLARAAAAAPSGATVALRAGTYRESVVVGAKRLTIQAYPGERVTLNGSDPVTGWVADGGAWRKDGWASALKQGGRPDLLSATNPLATDPDMVFVDGRALRQVTDRASVVTGTFWVDDAARRLWVGTDPTGRQVEAAARARGLVLNKAHGSVVRGLAVVRYGNHPDDLGALLVDADDVVVEHSSFAQNASVGLSLLGDRARVSQVTANDNGQIGLHGNSADDLVVERSLLQHNDTESFKVTSAEGNLKVTSSQRVRVAGNLCRWSVGRGLWFDVGSRDLTIVDNVVHGNADRGVQVEISGQATVASNLIADNGSDGLSLIAADDVDVFHNSFWRNGRAIWLVADDRPYALRDVVIRNNVMSGTRSTAQQVVAVEDVTRTRTAESMLVSLDDNAYAQVGTGARSWFGWASYPSAYRVFSGLEAFRTATGQEAGGAGIATSTEPFFTAPATGDFRLLASPVLAQVAPTPLPDRVAAALGVPSGSTLGLGSRVTDTLLG